MNFLLTNYIYPLEEQICLSEELGIYLDNPKKDYEIEFTSRFLETSYKFREDEFKDLPDFAYSFIGTPIEVIERVIEGFVESWKEGGSEYIKEIETTTDPFDKLAKLWIITRFDDNGQFEYMMNSVRERFEKTGETYFFLTDEEDIIEISTKSTKNFWGLVSLLVNPDFVWRGDVILSESLSCRRLNIHTFEDPLFILRTFTHIITGEDSDTDPENWFLYFPVVANDLIKYAALIDKILKTPEKEKLLFIGNIFNTAISSNDIYTRIVMLTSAIELLLTHSPDYSRFNVEESISKQFQLKASIIIWQNDKTKNIEEIKKRLRTIYSMRSNIAHGNFKEIQKYKNSLKKILDEDGEPVENIDDLVTDLLNYLKAILMEYLLNPDFVNFLKAN